MLPRRIFNIIEVYRINSAFCFNNPKFKMSSFVGCTIRSAKVDDLPMLRSLIVDSFLAMAEFHGEGAKEMLQKFAEDSMSHDLTIEKFLHVYFDNPLNHYWVAETTPGNIIGSVAIKRVNVAEAELVRMAVDPSMRGKGLGSLLINTSNEFCKSTKVQRLHIVTGNPKSRDFYVKSGAVITQTKMYKLGNGVETAVAFLVKYFGDKLIRKVAIVGGTHGNERIGVELIRQWSRDNRSIQRSTFTVLPVLGNPEAVLEYRRFVDEDLNRQFTGWMKDIDNQQNESSAPIEKQRAFALNKLLGPKAASHQEEVGADFVIDLHSSTSNTGIVAMVSGIDHDLFARRLCYHLQKEIKDVHICSSSGGKDMSYSLDSVSHSGVAFEVGPLTHGLVDIELFEKTRNVVLKTLDFIEDRNLTLQQEMERSLGALLVGDRLLANYYTTGNGTSSQLVPVTLAPNAVVPSEFPVFEYFVRVGEIKYPESDLPVAKELIPGALDNDVYNKALFGAKSHFLHPRWQGNDWSIIKDNDPLFVASDGSTSTLLFNRADYLFASEAVSSASVDLYTLFIGEAAYAPRDIALTLYKKVQDRVF